MVRLVQPVVILLGLLFIFLLGIHSERTGFVREVLDPNLKRFTLPVLNAFRGDGPDAVELALTIPEASMDSLIAIRERALEAGVLDEGKDRWDTVTLAWNGSNMQARLRLKGGLVDHLRTNKWSFRIQLIDSGDVMGMRTFSIQHPNTRNFTYEWLFHRALRDQGLPFLNYAFIHVRINDKDRGLFAIEQHFDETLVVELGLGHVPVLKFDDEARIGTLRQMQQRSFDSEAPWEGEWQAAAVDAFHLRTVLKDPVLQRRFRQSVLKLEGFRSGRLTTSEVFDVDALAKLFALCDLLGAQHATDWRNLRFVPDTVTGVLRPIGFDANAGEPISAIRALRELGPIDFRGERWGFFDRLYTDRGFHERYIAYVDSFSTDGRLEDLLARINEGFDEQVELLRREFPNHPYSPDVFTHDRTVMRQTVYPDQPAVAYLQQTTGRGTTLALADLHGLPVECVAIAVNGDTVQLESPLLLPPREKAGPLSYVQYAMDMAVPEDATLRCAIRLVGMKQLWWCKVRPWPVQPAGTMQHK